MGPDEFAQIAGVIGPTGAVLWYMYVNRRPDAVKPDPVKDLTEALVSLRERVIKVETILEGMEKRNRE